MKTSGSHNVKLVSRNKKKTYLDSLFNEGYIPNRSLRLVFVILTDSARIIIANEVNV
jgi:hypothetical protein